MLFADGIIMAERASCSVSLSPAFTVLSVDSPAASSLPSDSPLASTVMDGPASPFLSGWSLSTTYAVIALATLPIGTAFCSPNESTVPRPVAAM